MTTTPAGWYPDPYGSPQLRWWDGSQWTDATHSPEHGQQPQPMPQPADPPQAAQPLWGHTAQLPLPQFGGQPHKSSAWPWVVGGIAVVVALAMVIGGVVFFLNNRTGTAVARPDTVVPSAPLDSIVPPEPSPPASAPPLPELPQPSGGRIIDPATGLSYAFPGDKWQVPKASDIDDASDPRLPLWTSGIWAISQQNYDGKNNDWVASVYTGQLPQIFPYSGPQDLQNMAGAMLVTYDQLFYGPAHERKILRNEAMKVGDRQAWVTEFEMDFSKQAKANGWKWKTEKGAFVLVDQGQGQRPAVLYASIPDNLDQSVLNRVLDSLQAR